MAPKKETAKQFAAIGNEPKAGRSRIGDMQIFAAPAIRAPAGTPGRRDNLPGQEVLENLGEFFKVLTDPTRLRILYTLGAGELCVFDLSINTGASVSSVSHHLAALKRVRLVKGRREGRVIFYSLDDDHVKSIIRYARDHLGESR